MDWTVLELQGWGSLTMALLGKFGDIDRYRSRYIFAHILFENSVFGGNAVENAHFL